MNKISIITINRNNAAGLENTIISVCDQIYTNFEFIIIDGASTDSSIDIINKYNSHIKYWISEKDSGIFEAMNKGIKKAKGDYCYFLNSGDTLCSPTTLDRIFSEKHHDSPFINGHQLNVIGEQKNRVPTLNRPITFFDLYWGTIKHQATFIRRDLFSKYGLYDESLKVTADWKFFLQTIGLHNEQPEFVDIDIVNFEWNGISTNMQSMQIQEKERASVINDLVPLPIQADYNNFRNLNRYKYIFEKINRNRFFAVCVKILYKLTPQ